MIIGQMRFPWPNVSS